MTIAEFAPLFSGRLAEYADCFVRQAETPAPVPGVMLADRAFIAGQVELFTQAHYPGGDRRAAASMWSKAHFATLLPPFMALTLLLQRSVDLRLGSIGCTFGPDGALRHIHLADTGRTQPAPMGEARFEGLTDGHLSPLIAALSAAGGVSKRVLWSNAGNVFDIAARRAAAVIGTTAAIADALYLLEQRRLADGRVNPLHLPVRYRETPEGTDRRRRVCCIRYLIGRLGYCSNCPLPEAHAADPPFRPSARLPD